MENQLQRYATAKDGSFIMKVAGIRPFLSIVDFAFNFQIGDLAVVYAKTMGKFNVSYQFVKPITKPSDAAHDLLSADRFVNGFILPMLNAFNHLLDTGNVIDEVYMQSFVNDFSLSNVQMTYKGPNTHNIDMQVYGSF